MRAWTEEELTYHRAAFANWREEHEREAQTLQELRDEVAALIAREFDEAMEAEIKASEARNDSMTMPFIPEGDAE